MTAYAIHNSTERSVKSLYSILSVNDIYTGVMHLKYAIQGPAAKGPGCVYHL
jgi:hypothetical protein